MIKRPGVNIHVWALLDKFNNVLDYSDETPTPDDLYVAKTSGERYVRLVSDNADSYEMTLFEIKLLADYHHAAAEEHSAARDFQRASIHFTRSSELMSLLETFRRDPIK